MTFTLPDLSYDYAALEPHIDAATMEIHHSRHHATYVTNANNLMEQAGIDHDDSLELLKNIDEVDAQYQQGLINNAGGHANHTFFWEILTPGGATEPSGALAEAINASFGSLEDMKSQFKDAALKRFGSGWIWVVRNDNGELEIISTANQDHPILSGKTPILGLDVWEHAYYLNYQNKRPDYVDAFWEVVNWEVVERCFNQ